ncbi:hypothetical protein ACLOJK_014837, partial [Asimina triloba]
PLHSLHNPSATGRRHDHPVHSPDDASAYRRHAHVHRPPATHDATRMHRPLAYHRLTRPLSATRHSARRQYRHRRVAPTVKHIDDRHPCIEDNYSAPPAT